jgi:hypothetical protein
MFFPVQDNGAAERHNEIRKAVHQNRNLVSRVQQESRQSKVVSRRANFAAQQAIELLEEAKRRDENSPD